MVTPETDSYCTRVKVSTGSTQFKCARYPMCKDRSGLKALENACLCGHNGESNKQLFKFNECSAGSYCSGDKQLTDKQSELDSGDLRCADYPDAMMTLVLVGLSTSDAQDSAKTVENVVKIFFKEQAVERVLFQSASFTPRRRLEPLYAEYRVSPMVSQASADELKAKMVEKKTDFINDLETDLSNKFNKDVAVAGLSIGDEKIYDNPSATKSSSGGKISIMMILIIGVSALVVLLVCFVLCKMRENRRLKQEMFKEENLGYKQDYSDNEVFVPDFPEENPVTPYSPSSTADEGGNTRLTQMAGADEEEGEGNPNRRTAHAQRARPMRLVTAGAFGEESSCDYESEVDKRIKGESSSPSKDKKAVYRLPKTPEKVVQPVDAVVLPMHTDQGHDSSSKEGGNYRRGSFGRRGKKKKKGQGQIEMKKIDSDSPLVNVPLGDEQPHLRYKRGSKSDGATNI